MKKKIYSEEGQISKFISLSEERIIRNLYDNPQSNKEVREKTRRAAIRRAQTEEGKEHLKRLGMITSTKHPEIGGKLGQWVKDHPEHSRRVIRETRKKYPNYFGGLGCACHLKNPGHWNKTIGRWRKENPELHRLQNINNGSNGQVLAQYAKNNKEEYIKYGSMSFEKQAKFTHVSKPEKIMKTLLPKDFIMNKRFGRYVPDFRSEKRKMIIEVDGIYWHNYPLGKPSDKIRDKYYQNKGYTTFRFWDKSLEIATIKKKIKKIF